MNKLGFVLLGLAACSQQKHAGDTHRILALSAPAKASVPATRPAKRALMIPIPKDHAQLQRLLAMGYTIHEDHLHAPGVTSCPKMSENPVQ